MKIVVFGANGKVGHRVVAELLQRGHHVRAFVHSRSNLLPQHDNLEIVHGDACSAQDVTMALDSIDVAISTLSSWKSSGEVLSTWASLVVNSAHATPALQVVSLTGSAVLQPKDHTAWYDYLNRAILRIIASRVFHDGARHIDILAGSSLDWHVLRSPVMRVKPSHTYQLSTHPPLPWQTIPYDAVTQALCDIAEKPRAEHRTPFIVPY